MSRRVRDEGFANETRDVASSKSMVGDGNGRALDAASDHLRASNENRGDINELGLALTEDLAVAAVWIFSRVIRIVKHKLTAGYTYNIRGT